MLDPTGKPGLETRIIWALVNFCSEERGGGLAEPASRAENSKLFWCNDSHPSLFTPQTLRSFGHLTIHSTILFVLHALIIIYYHLPSSFLSLP